MKHISRKESKVSEIVEHMSKECLTPEEQLAIDITYNYAGIGGITTHVCILTETVKAMSVAKIDPELILGVVIRNIKTLNYVGKYFSGGNDAGPILINNTTVKAVKESRGVDLLYLHYPALSLLEAVSREGGVRIGDQPYAVTEFLTVYRCMLAMVYDLTEAIEQAPIYADQMNDFQESESTNMDVARNLTDAIFKEARGK